MSCSKCNNTCSTCSCTCSKSCKNTNCDCAVLITSDCVNNVVVDLECAGILKGQTLSEVLVQLDAYICEKFGTVQNFLQIVNIGGGSEVYKGVNNLGKKELRTLVSDGSITITQNSDTISLTINQNNFVRQLIISDIDLPNNYDEQDICDYILALPAGQRTILETDSKWNIVIEEGAS